MTTIFENAGLIGLGLIGGSLARAMKKHAIAKNIIGYTNSKASSMKALELGMIDTIANSISDLAKECDIIIICTPLSTYENIAKEIAASIEGRKCIITDVGSLKVPVINAFNKYLLEENKKYLIPAHPIAGTEKTGVESGFAELFIDKKTILTPEKETSIDAIKLVEKLWHICGSNTEILSAKKHDEIYAEVSHLPQFLAYCYASLLVKNCNSEDSNSIADEFWKFSRICASEPTIWLDIFTLNQTNLLICLDKFVVEIQEILNKLYNSIPPASSGKINYHKYLTHDLPAIISTALIKCSPHQQYSGSGFKDFTSYVNIKHTQNKCSLLGNFLDEVQILASLSKSENYSGMMNFMKEASEGYMEFKNKHS